MRWGLSVRKARPEAVIDGADLFCGAGGTSEGLTRACVRAGKKLRLIAVNHWQLAIDTHEKNHPEARHVCAALEGLNPRDLIPSGRLKILVASPECTNHSVARGGRPINDQSRASAWLVLKWLQELYVENVLIENVKEFREWGPLGADGRPLKSKRGDLFRQFIATLRSLGYEVEWRILNAANYGDPTTRERLFVLARRGRKRAITWPAQTHARADKVGTLFGALKPWRPAREIIDWSLPGTSIFARKKPLAMNTLKRILAGMEKFNWPEPFIVVLRQHMNARSVDEPLPTITAGGSHLGLCEPFMVAAGGPEGKGRHAQSINDPLSTVLAENHTGMVRPFIMTAHHGDSGSRPVRSMSEPIPTVTGSNDHALVEPLIVKFDHQGTNGARARSVDSPLPTVTTKNGLAVVEGEAFILPQFGESAAKSISEPLGAVTTTSRGIGLAQPLIVEMRNGKAANLIDAPLSTVATSGAHHGLAEPFIDKYYGSGVAADIGEPLDTVTAKARFGLCQVGDAVYDIRFRMLRPRELARAQGFPDWYEFPKQSAAATKLIGNAVPTNLAEALCMELIG